MIVEMGRKITLDYESFVDGKLLDSSKVNKPLEIIYGFTKINKTLDEKIKGQKIGFKCEFEQKVSTDSFELEFSYSDFDEDTIETMKKQKEINLEFRNKQYSCDVNYINDSDEKIILSYKEPLAGKTIKQIITIKNISEKIFKKNLPSS